MPTALPTADELPDLRAEQARHPTLARLDWAEVCATPYLLGMLRITVEARRAARPAPVPSPEEFTLT